jgi:hypothetical protein
LKLLQIGPDASVGASVSTAALACQKPFFDRFSFSSDLLLSVAVIADKKDRFHTMTQAWKSRFHVV